MRTALSEALQQFNGALLVISHDRSLLRSTVDELVLVADTAVEPFSDDLDGYARWLADHRARASNTSDDQTVTGVRPAVDRKQQKRDAAEQRAKLRPLRQGIEKLERQMDKCMAELSETRNRLASNELYNPESKAELTELLATEATLKKQLASVEEQLLEQMQVLELAENEASKE